MSFDILNYSVTAHRVVDEDVDYSAFERAPLPDDALRALQYMSDVESHTICYLRDLLVTPSHQDPEITTFLTMWAYEEFWHGEVLDGRREAERLGRPVPSLLRHGDPVFSSFITTTKEA